MILDLVIEAGNPADSDRLLPMLERHIAFYGQAPRQAAADGGFASRANLAGAKARGVRDMAFHKKAGLRIEDMVRSHWVYRKLRNFRAGIEADISCLKRAYGLARCTHGVGSPASGPMSGHRWSPTISPSSPASSRPDANHQRHRLQANRRALAGHPCLNSVASPTHRRALGSQVNNSPQQSKQIRSSKFLQ